MKKAFAVIVLATSVALALCLIGCGNTSSSSSDSEGSSSAASDDAKNETKAVEVKLGEQVSTDKYDFTISEFYWETIGEHGIIVYGSEDGPSFTSAGGLEGDVAFIVKGTLTNKMDSALNINNVLGDSVINGDIEEKMAFRVRAEKADMIAPHETEEFILFIEASPALQDSFKFADVAIGFTFGASRAKELEDCDEVYSIHLE